MFFRFFIFKLHSRCTNTLHLIEIYGLFSLFIQSNLCYEMKTLGRKVTSSPFLYNKAKKEILNKFESACVNSKSFGNNSVTKSIQTIPNQIIPQIELKQSQIKTFSKISNELLSQKATNLSIGLIMISGSLIPKIHLINFYVLMWIMKFISYKY